MNIMVRMGGGRLARVVLGLSGSHFDIRTLACFLGTFTMPSDAGLVAAAAGSSMRLQTGPGGTVSHSFGSRVAEPFLDEDEWLDLTVGMMAAGWDAPAGDPRPVRNPDAGGWIWDGSQWLAPVVVIGGFGGEQRTVEPRLEPALAILWGWENDPLSLADNGRTLFAEDWRRLVSSLTGLQAASLLKAAARDGGVPGVGADWLSSLAEAGALEEGVGEAVTEGGTGSI